MTLKNDEKFEEELTDRYEEFDEFGSKHSRISKIWTLMGSFWPKYIMLELKKYRRIIFHDAEEWSKFKQRLTCGLENDMRNLAHFYQGTQKSLNWDFDGILIQWCKSWKGIDLSFPNWHGKFDEFWPDHSKVSKFCTLMAYFWPKSIIFALKKCGRVMFDGIEDWCKIWCKENWLMLSRLIWGIWQILTGLKIAISF